MMPNNSCSELTAFMIICKEINYYKNNSVIIEIVAGISQQGSWSIFFMFGMCVTKMCVPNLQVVSDILSLAKSFCINFQTSFLFVYRCTILVTDLGRWSNMTFWNIIWYFHQVSDIPWAELKLWLLQKKLSLEMGIQWVTVKSWSCTIVLMWHKQMIRIHISFDLLR